MSVQDAHLCRHVHQQHGSDRGLGLAVALLWAVQGVGFQNAEQVLLPAGVRPPELDCHGFLRVMSHGIRQPTRVLPATQTSRGKETVGGGLSQSHLSIWGLRAPDPAPGTHAGDK